MNNFKRAQVIMLATEHKTCIGKEKIGNMLRFNSPRHNLYHKNLYIISDDEIKEDDWVIDSSGVLRMVNRINEEGRLHLSDLFALTILPKSCKKIIATTDTSLEFLKYCPEITEDTYKRTLLPQPSQQFIKKYIEEYNKGNIIKDVLVEYVNYTPGIDDSGYGFPTGNTINILKINSKDNTITIKKLKESWNREEVIDLLNNFIWDYSENRGYNQNKIDDWIKENL